MNIEIKYNIIDKLKSQSSSLYSGYTMTKEPWTDKKPVLKSSRRQFANLYQSNAAVTSRLDRLFTSTALKLLRNVCRRAETHD